MRRMCTDGHSSHNTLSLRRIICVSKSHRLWAGDIFSRLLINAIEKYADIGKYIIPSSTTGSTKKFQIAVDDSGTISATEVKEVR